MIIRDRVDKVVGFFTYGGWLESISVPGETVYSLRSPAPILELTDVMVSDELQKVLLEEKDWLEETQQWTNRPPTLEQLLSP
ncbi:MAG: hypothetical protein ACE5I2_15160 [Anaerolineae bacterium]